MAALFFLDPGFAWQERVQPRAVSSSPRTIFLPAKKEIVKRNASYSGMVNPPASG